MQDAASETGEEAGGRAQKERSLSHLWGQDQDPGWVDDRARGPQALLGQAPHGDAARQQERPMRAELPLGTGKFILILLAGTMAGLRDRLILDGFGREAELVADLVDITGDYLTRCPVDEDDDEDAV